MLKFMTIIFCFLLLTQNVNYGKQRDDTPPDIVLSIKNARTINLKITDEPAGIKEVFINNKRITGNAAENLDLLLKDETEDEFIRIYAKDYADNQTDTFVIANPYYIGPVKPILYDIKKTDLAPIKKGKTTFYPITSYLKEEDTTVEYYRYQEKKDIDIIKSEKTSGEIQSRHYHIFIIEKKAMEQTKEQILNSGDYKDHYDASEKTIPFKNDGYTGTLNLNPDSINPVQNEVEKNSRTKTETRVYPGLYDEDSSLIPKTITSSGGEYMLDAVSWENNEHEEENNYDAAKRTAIATYKKTFHSNVIKNYKSNPVYTGNVYRLTQLDSIAELEIHDKTFAEKQKEKLQKQELQKQMQIRLQHISIAVAVVLILLLAAVSYIAKTKEKKHEKMQK